MASTPTCPVKFLSGGRCDLPPGHSGVHRPDPSGTVTAARATRIIDREGALWLSCADCERPTVRLEAGDTLGSALSVHRTHPCTPEHSMVLHTVTLTRAHLREIMLPTSLEGDRLTLDHGLPPLGDPCLALRGDAAQLVEFILAAHQWAAERGDDDLEDRLRRVQHRRTIDGSLYVWPLIAPQS